MTDGAAIKGKREEMGWSQGRLADEASARSGQKIAQQVVARLESGGESKHKMAILQALDLIRSPTVTERLNAELAPDAPPFLSQAGGLRDVPELGIAVGGFDGDFELNGTVVDYVRRPPALLHRKVFAIRVKSDSMEPRFDEGDVLYIDEQREPRPGEDAVIELKSTAEHYPGRALVKRLVSKTPTFIIVRQFNPKQELTFRRDEVKALLRVIPNNELIGL